MISKYISAILGVVLLTMSGYVFYLNGVISDKDNALGMAKAQLTICEASAENLKQAITHQNSIIDNFNRKLEDTNSKLSKASTENVKLKSNVSKQLNSINKKQLEGCTDTMEWMLDEAINISTTN